MSNKQNSFNYWQHRTSYELDSRNSEGNIRTPIKRLYTGREARCSRRESQRPREETGAARKQQPEYCYVRSSGGISIWGRRNCWWGWWTTQHTEGIERRLGLMTSKPRWGIITPLQSDNVRWGPDANKLAWLEELLKNGGIDGCGPYWKLNIRAAQTMGRERWIDVCHEVALWIKLRQSQCLESDNSSGCDASPSLWETMLEHFFAMDLV